jgi:hypothetical protein
MGAYRPHSHDTPHTDQPHGPTPQLAGSPTGHRVVCPPCRWWLAITPPAFGLGLCVGPPQWLCDRRLAAVVMPVSRGWGILDPGLFGRVHCGPGDQQAVGALGTLTATFCAGLNSQPLASRRSGWDAQHPRHGDGFRSGVCSDGTGRYGPRLRPLGRGAQHRLGQGGGGSSFPVGCADGFGSGHHLGFGRWCIGPYCLTTSAWITRRTFLGKPQSTP